MPTLALLRHGQSQWNLENRFTGWVDVDLSPLGEAEARRAGELIKAEAIDFDRAYASVLKRAIRTAGLALAVADQLWIPFDKDWRLNERHYGALTGLNKAQTAAIHGEASESLQTTLWRVLPYWDGEIAPALAGGASVIVAAHGNSLRAIVKHLFAVPDQGIAALEVPTGNPMLIELSHDLRPLSARYLDAARAQPLPSSP